MAQTIIIILAILFISGIDKFLVFFPSDLYDRTVTGCEHICCPAVVLLVNYFHFDMLWLTTTRQSGFMATSLSPIMSLPGPQPLASMMI